MPQSHPTGPAGPQIEAMPAALQEDDPLLGTGLLPQVEAGVGAVVAGDVGVDQVGPFQGATVIPGVGGPAGGVHYHVVALDHVHAGLPQRILVQARAGPSEAVHAGLRSGQVTKRGPSQQSKQQQRHLKIRISF